MDKEFDFLSAISGTDPETGGPKCSIVIQLQEADANGEYQVSREESMMGPTIQAMNRGEYVELSFLFQPGQESMLRAMMGALDTYAKQFDKDAKERKEYPAAFIMSMVPEMYSGGVIAFARMPVMWSMSASGWNGVTDTIKIIFDAACTEGYVDENYDLEADREVYAAKQEEADFYQAKMEEERERTKRRAEIGRRSLRN